jgi:hypothetical protein
MPIRNALVSWIGTTDLLSMAADLDKTQRERVCDALKHSGTLKKQDGPIRTLLRHESFQSIHLLSNYAPFMNPLFAKWVGGGATVHAVKLEDPTDYAGIFAAVKGMLDGRGNTLDTELSIFLSPGTPAMAADWILVGKSRPKTTFYQSHSDRAWKTEIPFDLVANFVPQLVTAPDSGLQDLAAKQPSEIEGFERIVGSSRVLRLAAGRAE